MILEIIASLGLSVLIWTNGENGAEHIDSPGGTWWIRWLQPFLVHCLCPWRRGSRPAPPCSYYQGLQGALNWGHNLCGNKETINRFLKV